MHDRSALGSADVSNAALSEMVGRLLGRAAEDVAVVESSAEVAPYDLEALTTAGRYRVRGRARIGPTDHPFSFFVKVVQSWSRSPMFQFVPAEFREQALASVPWRIEPLIYASDLGDRLPDGLKMATAFAVFDIDDESAAIWMRDVDADARRWEPERYAHAARLLGRLAASPRVQPLAAIGRGNQSLVRSYAEGRVALDLLPTLNSDVWAHPLVAAAFDGDLRNRLLDVAAMLPSLVDELEALPQGTFHGDACSRNLLVERGSTDLVLIDFGFWGNGPLGFDLSQLLVGEVQMGERSAAELPALEAACLPAYVDGLRAEGCDAPLDVVRRAHALQMLLFAGFSALPLEHLDREPTDDVRRIARERAESLRFILDLVDATAPVSAA